MEALNRFECYFLNTMEQLCEHLDAVDHPHVKAMYDTFHSNIEEKDPVAAVKAIKKHMIHVHVSKTTGARRARAMCPGPRPSRRSRRPSMMAG